MLKYHLSRVVVCCLVASCCFTAVKAQHQEFFDVSYTHAWTFYQAQNPGSLELGGINKVSFGNNHDNVFLSPSFLVGNDKKMGFSTSYFDKGKTPNNPQGQFAIAGYWKSKLGPTMAISYFRNQLGKVVFGEETEDNRLFPREQTLRWSIGMGKPVGFSWGVGASLMLSEAFAISQSKNVNGRQIMVPSLIPTLIPAIDLNLAYVTPVFHGFQHSFGLGLDNLAPKTSQYPRLNFAKRFSPVRIGAGYSLKYQILDNLDIQMAYQVDKVLVPMTNRVLNPMDSTMDGRNFVVVKGSDPYVGLFQAIYANVTEAQYRYPSRVSELEHRIGGQLNLRMKEVVISFRTGIHKSYHETMNYSYASMGIGLSYDKYRLKFGFAQGLSPDQPKYVKGGFINFAVDF